MISYKTYKMINESLGSTTLGLAPVKSIGVMGSKMSEMGIHPDELEDVMGDEEEMMGDEMGMDGEEEMGDEMGMDGEEEMGDEMGMDGEEAPPMDDEMGAEEAPFSPPGAENMAKLAGLEDDDEMGDELEDELEDEEMEDDLDGLGDEIPMEAKKHMCPEDSSDEEHQEEDDKMKYMKKDKCTKYMGKDCNESDDFMSRFFSNAAGRVRKVNFKEDAVLPPQNPNVGLGDQPGATPGKVGYAPQQRIGGIGDSNGSVETDILGYQSIPSFADYVEARNKKQSEQDELVEG